MTHKFFFEYCKVRQLSGLTETLNVMMTDKFLEAINNKMLTLMALLDLSKAFNSIDHAKLLDKLSSLRMSCTAHQNGSGATFTITSSIYELALKYLECILLNMESLKDPSLSRHYLMFTQTICQAFQITAPQLKILIVFLTYRRKDGCMQRG